MAGVACRKGQVQPVAPVAPYDRGFLPVAKRIDVNVPVDGRLGRLLAPNGRDDGKSEQDQPLPEPALPACDDLRQPDLPFRIADSRLA